MRAQTLGKLAREVTIQKNLDGLADFFLKIGLQPGKTLVKVSRKLNDHLPEISRSR